MRLQVVGVVVAVAQHIGADHDAALHFGAEALRARLLVHVLQVLVLGGAVAVAHAVVARQVRRRFGRGDHVVGGNRQGGVRQRDVDQGGAQLFILRQRAAHGRFHVLGQALAEILARHADAQARQGLIQVARKIFRHAALFRRQAGRVALVEAGHGGEQQGAVFGRAGHRAALVQRRGKGDHAEARHAAIRRLDAGDAAKSGRLADRAARVGAGGRWRQAGRHGGSRAARGTARHGRLVPRVLHGAEGRVLVAGAHGEFIAVDLAQGDHAGRLEFFHHGGVKRAGVVGQHLRAGSRAPAFRDEQILVRDRHARQWRGRAGGDARVRLRGLRQGQGTVDVQKGVRGVRFDAVEEMRRQCNGGNFLVLQKRGQLFDGFCMHGVSI